MLPYAIWIRFIIVWKDRFVKSAERVSTVGSHMYECIVHCDRSRWDQLTFDDLVIATVFFFLLKSRRRTILFAIYGFHFFVLPDYCFILLSKRDDFFTEAHGFFGKGYGLQKILQLRFKIKLWQVLSRPTNPTSYANCIKIAIKLNRCRTSIQKPQRNIKSIVNK